MGGYWIDSPDNPFNQMSYTRGGGGYDNSGTHESNARRSDAMQGAGAAALPHFATVGIAQAYYPGKGYAVVGGNVIRTTGPGASGASTQGGSGGAGSGSAVATTDGKPGRGGAGAGSRLVLAYPGSRMFPDERGGWAVPRAWEDAPDISGVKNLPLERVGIGGPQEAPAAISSLGWARTTTGYMPVPSADIKDRIEDGPLEWMWFAQNVALPHLGIGEHPRPEFLDPNYSHLNRMMGEWRDGGNPRSTPIGRVLTGGGF